MRDEAEKHSKGTPHADIAGKVLRNAAINWIARGASGLAYLLFIIALARYLGDALFGKYAYALSLAAMFAMAGDFGFSTLLAREIARERSNASRIFSASLGLFLLTSLAAYLVLVSVALAGRYQQEVTLTILILGVAQFLESFLWVNFGVYRGFQKMEFEALISAVNRISVAILGGILIYLKSSLPQIALGILAGYVVAALLSIAIIHTRFAHIARPRPLRDSLRLLRLAWPIGLGLIFSAVAFRVDKVILSLFYPPNVVGWYAAADKLIEALRFGPAFFIFAAFPVYSEFFKKSREDLALAWGKSFKFLLLTVTPVAIGTTFLSHKIILLIYGQAFARAATPLGVLAWSLVLLSLNSVMSYLLVAVEKQVFALIGQVICTAAVVGFDFALIPHLGHVGASIAALGSQAIYFGMNFYMARKFIGVSCKGSETIKLIIANLLLGGIIYCLLGLPLALVVSIALVAYFGLVLALRVFSLEELRAFAKTLRIAGSDGGQMWE